MARTWEVTNTNVQVNAEVMKKFKNVIGKQGYRLQKGIEIALADYIKKHGDGKLVTKELLEALS